MTDTTDKVFARRLIDVNPASPMTEVLYRLLPALSKKGDLEGMRRLWKAIAIEFSALWPNANPKHESNLEIYETESGERYVHPYETTFRLGWHVYSDLVKVVFTGRKVREWDSAALGGGRMVTVRESWHDETAVHAAFLRILARFYA
jgi:hypothetical protein